MTTEKLIAQIEKRAPLLFFVALLLGLEIIYGGYFPYKHGLLGYDFSYAHPALLEGAFWFWQNGIFSVPWFTPSFCGGQPFFADPISSYYSLTQVLAFFVQPTTASHITLLLSCSMGYWAFFYLSRNVFQLSTGAAIVAGTLAMLNGFTPYRILVGETGFQAFLLSAFVSHALLSNNQWSPWQKWKLGNSFWAGLTLAYMFQSGLSSLMVPVGLGIIAVACLARIVRNGTHFKIFFGRGVLAVVFAGAICSAKIMAGFTFMSNFPRDSYLLPGFSSWGDALIFPLLSLIFDSETVSVWANLKLVNVQWPIMPHEWAYQFGLTYLGLVLAGLCSFYWFRLRNPGTQTKLNFDLSRGTSYIFILTLILLIPSALLWWNPQWNALLKTLPIVKTTSFPVRWIIILIPVACVAGAIAWQTTESIIKTAALRIVVLAVFCLSMLLESGLTNRDFYVDPNTQGYDPKWINQAWANGKKGKIPPIAALVEMKQDKYGRWPLPQNRNDYLVIGESFIRCYSPIYGYHLEALPVGRLRAGHPALEEQGGFLNIKKPSCLIWPAENGCAAIGEEYKIQEKEQAQLFLQRRPIDFEISTGQRIANSINIFALLVAAIGIFSYTINTVRQLLGCINR